MSEVPNKIVALRLEFLEKHRCNPNALIISDHYYNECCDRYGNDFFPTEPVVFSTIYGMAVLITNKINTLRCIRLEDAL